MSVAMTVSGEASVERSSSLKAWFGDHFAHGPFASCCVHLGAVAVVDLGDRTDEAEHREDDGEQRERAEQRSRPKPISASSSGEKRELVAAGAPVHLPE